MQLMPWMVTATLTGCPATVATIGRTSVGLPVGMQIMGPFWEDATSIEFAAFLSDEIGGFKKSWLPDLDSNPHLRGGEAETKNKVAARSFRG
jgi:hypothetical protein